MHHLFYLEFQLWDARIFEIDMLISKIYSTWTTFFRSGIYSQKHLKTRIQSEQIRIKVTVSTPRCNWSIDRSRDMYWEHVSSVLASDGANRHHRAVSWHMPLNSHLQTPWGFCCCILWSPFYNSYWIAHISETERTKDSLEGFHSYGIHPKQSIKNNLT